MTAVNLKNISWDCATTTCLETRNVELKDGAFPEIESGYYNLTLDLKTGELCLQDQDLGTTTFFEVSLQVTKKADAVLENETISLVNQGKFEKVKSRIEKHPTMTLEKMLKIAVKKAEEHSIIAWMKHENSDYMILEPLLPKLLKNAEKRGFTKLVKYLKKLEKNAEEKRDTSSSFYDETENAPTRMKKLSSLFSYISRSFRLAFVEHEGVKYFNRENEWCSPEKDSTETGRCNGYEECEFHDRIPQTSEVTYELRYEPDIGDDKKEEVKDRAFEKLGALGKIFPDNLTVTVKNTSGFNDDHRGSDHTKLELEYQDTFTLRGPTMKDLAEAFFRVKSHKFDLWYELFDDVESIEKEDDNLLIEIDFDHGS